MHVSCLKLTIGGEQARRIAVIFIGLRRLKTRSFNGGNKAGAVGRSDNGGLAVLQIHADFGNARQLFEVSFQFAHTAHASHAFDGKLLG